MLGRCCCLLLLLPQSAPLTTPFSADALLEDKSFLEQQLGYLPPNFVRVSARNHRGYPIAIQTYPLAGGSPRRQAKAAVGSDILLGTPFPTLYWLTCPDLNRAIANLERQGGVAQLEAQLDGAMQARLWQCHAEYAAARWSSLTEVDRDALSQGAQVSSSLARMRDMLKHSGIAGTNLTKHNEQRSNNNQQKGGSVPSIKCLHTHYAHFRSVAAALHDENGLQHSAALLNPVGQLVHWQLQNDEPDLVL